MLMRKHMEKVQLNRKQDGIYCVEEQWEHADITDAYIFARTLEYDSIAAADLLKAYLPEYDVASVSVCRDRHLEDVGIDVYNSFCADAVTKDGSQMYVEVHMWDETDDCEYRIEECARIHAEAVPQGETADSIFISLCKTDPIGDGCHLYEYQYGDVRYLFVNLKSKEESDKKQRALVDYFNGQPVSDTLCRRLHKDVAMLKQNPAIKKRFLMLEPMRVR